MTTSGITVFGQPSQPNHGAGGRIAMDDAVFPTDYVALDLETTGFYPNSCAITEIGAVRVREGHIVDQFQQLVNPLRPIPRQITTLTGITDAMVADLDPIDEVLPRFIAWLATPAAGPAVEPIVGHNVSFDLRFLDYNTRHIAAAALPARIMTRCRSAAPCSPRSGITVWRPDRTLRHRGQ